MIALSIVLRRVHIALGIERVIERPIGDGGASDRCCKSPFGRLQDGHQRHVATIRPTLDANLVAIHIRLRLQPIDTNQEIPDLRNAHLAINHVFKCTAAIGHAAIVEAEDDIALARIELVGQAFPIAIDRLGVRSAIGFDQSWILLAGIEIWWKLDRVIQRLAIIRGQRAIFRHCVVLEIWRIRMRFIELVLFNPGDQRPIGAVQAGLGRLGWA